MQAGLPGDEFLNRLGHSMQHDKKTHGQTTMDFRREFPRLDAFEDVIADWMTCRYRTSSVAGPRERGSPIGRT